MGNTASERVAGERHGAKAARAEGAGGHGPGKEHRIMVGSTDDPSVFSLPDSKVSVPSPPVGGDAAVGWVSGRLLPFPVLITLILITVKGVFGDRCWKVTDSSCGTASK